MARAFITRVGLAAAAALVAMSLVASAALAGEITGNGKSLEPPRSNSICAYSGLNDDPRALTRRTDLRVERSLMVTM